MTGTIIEKSYLKNVLFNHVDLQQSQFNDILDSGNIRFIQTNLIGSNVNVTSNQISLIADSFLPNKTFRTSFTRFGMNLIENSDAEQGLCYDMNQSSIEATPYGWFRHNDVIQMHYKNNNWTVNIINYTNDWGTCFFSGGKPYSKEQAKLNTNAIQQEINFEQLSVLIDARQAKYYASAYLGGFESDIGSTSMRIEFKDMQNKTTHNLAFG